MARASPKSRVPYLLTILAGRYIFRIHPGILLGMGAGRGTSSPGLAAVQEKAEKPCASLRLWGELRNQCIGTCSMGITHRDVGG